MSLKRREEKRLHRAQSELETGLRRGRVDLALEALLELPPASREVYLERARRLLVASVCRERALGHTTILSDWGRRLQPAGLASAEPQVAEACWQCLWAAWELQP